MTTKAFLLPLLLTLMILLPTGCKRPRINPGTEVRETVGTPGTSDRDKWLPVNGMNSGTTGRDSNPGGSTIIDIPGRRSDIDDNGKGMDDFTSLDNGPLNPDLGQDTIINDRRWVPVYFGYNQSRIGETERQKLSELATYLVENGEFHVLIEGHCDERGSEEYNRGLGERRALSVKDYLQELGVTDGRMRTLSYGEEKPADPASTEAAYALNRRAEFVILLPRNSK